MTPSAPPTRRSHASSTTTVHRAREPDEQHRDPGQEGDDADWRTPNANETHALVAGLTCGRPSNPATGEDECHAEASYAIIDKGIKENRNHATKITRQRR